MVLCIHHDFLIIHPSSTRSQRNLMVVNEIFTLINIVMFKGNTMILVVNGCVVFSSPISFNYFSLSLS